MKTAMQQLIEWLKSQEELARSNGNSIYADFMNGHINVAELFLPLEYEQIVKAYKTGVEEDVYNNPLKTGEQYYSETYD